MINEVLVGIDLQDEFFNVRTITNSYSFAPTSDEEFELEVFDRNGFGAIISGYHYKNNVFTISTHGGRVTVRANKDINTWE